MIDENKLKVLEKKANNLKRLRKLQNEILSNCAYSDQEANMQLNRLEKMNTGQKEKAIINGLWNIRQKLGKDLLDEIEKIIKVKDDK